MNTLRRDIAHFLSRLDGAVWYGDEVIADDFGGFDMIGTAMTIVMAAYSGRRRDVAIISDRRAAPNALGRAAGVAAQEGVYKTLRLGPRVAIGFGGTVPLSNMILARFLGCQVPEMDDDLLSRLVPGERAFNKTFEDVARYLDECAGPAMAQGGLPEGIQTSAVLVGESNGRTTLAGWSALSAWKVRVRWAKAPWCRPKDMLASDKDAFEEYTTRPGLDYVASLKAAVGFCADRYDSVNHNYVLRRLGAGFAREEGSVQPGLSLP